MLGNPISIMLTPTKHWQLFASKTHSQYKVVIPYLLIMALLPSISWFYGTTQVGWKVGDGSDIIRLTEASAFKISIAMYFALIFAVVILGVFCHWMSRTFNSESSNLKGISLVALTATPFFVFSLAGLHPHLILDMILGIIAIVWWVFLLFNGLPVAMNIPKDQGFMYAAALMTAAFTIFISMLGVTTILWGFGVTPVFID